MNQKEFIEKWRKGIRIYYNDVVEKEFISDLSSLFQTRSEEEVREKLEYWKQIRTRLLPTGNEERSHWEATNRISLLKWFLLKNEGE